MVNNRNRYIELKTINESSGTDGHNNSGYIEEMPRRTESPQTNHRRRTNILVINARPKSEITCIQVGRTLNDDAGEADAKRGT